MARMITALLVVLVATVSCVSGCRSPAAGKAGASTNDIESVISQFAINSPEARKRIERYVVEDPEAGEQILLRIAYTHKFNDLEARRFVVQQMGKLKMPRDARTYEGLSGLAGGDGDVDAVVALMEMGNSTADKLLGRGFRDRTFRELGVLRNRPVVFDGLLRMACAASPQLRPTVLAVLSEDASHQEKLGVSMDGKGRPPAPVRYAPYSELTEGETKRRVKLIEGLNTNGFDRRSLDLLEKVKQKLNQRLSRDVRIQAAVRAVGSSQELAREVVESHRTNDHAFAEGVLLALAKSKEFVGVGLPTGAANSNLTFIIQNLGDIQPEEPESYALLQTHVIVRPGIVVRALSQIGNERSYKILAERLTVEHALMLGQWRTQLPEFKCLLWLAGNSDKNRRLALGALVSDNGMGVGEMTGRGESVQKFASYDSLDAGQRERMLDLVKKVNTTKFDKMEVDVLNSLKTVLSSNAAAASASK